MTRYKDVMKQRRLFYLNFLSNGGSVLAEGGHFKMMTHINELTISFNERQVMSLIITVIIIIITIIMMLKKTTKTQLEVRAWL